MYDFIEHDQHDDGWRFAIVDPDTREPLARSTGTYASRELCEEAAEAMLDTIRAWGC